MRSSSKQDKNGEHRQLIYIYIHHQGSTERYTKLKKLQSPDTEIS